MAYAEYLVAGVPRVVQRTASRMIEERSDNLFVPFSMRWLPLASLGLVASARGDVAVRSERIEAPAWVRACASNLNGARQAEMRIDPAFARGHVNTELISGRWWISLQVTEDLPYDDFLARMGSGGRITQFSASVHEASQPERLDLTSVGRFPMRWSDIFVCCHGETHARERDGERIGRFSWPAALAYRDFRPAIARWQAVLDRCIE